MRAAIAHRGMLIISAAALISVCAPAQTVDAVTLGLGPGCGFPAPSLVATPPELDGPFAICVDSVFPNAHGFLFIGTPLATPLQILPGCFVYIDLLSAQLLFEFFTDASGGWCAAFDLPNEPALLGMEFGLQSYVWAATAQSDDHTSNGVALTLGNDLPGGEGCTPGYWRTSQHFDDWTAPYTPSTLFGSVFADAFPGMTLLEVLQLGGDGLNALGRHAVAALLNAASPEVDYDMTASDVINAFNAVATGTPQAIEQLKDVFDGLNNLGCNL